MLAVSAVSEYLNKAVMEEEAEGGRSGDEGLLELVGDGGPNDVFDVGADVGVVVLPELSHAHFRQEAQAESGEH